ncbi:helix-turn-helix domain-containing protein [Methylobacter sp. S3L5C]|uniref:AraC family transcriptional regulator n=1 Tax=Methylobacter sp. S3L5C TaxID=2839024 RepID=UPI001FAB6414|nr:helix-turn-helix domain-containing protein [Methylobacter sp. S3L5C]UOA07135.1 helix-turn-helix domain-containing protein [Methylobacter sp. S3L5C]
MLKLYPAYMRLFIWRGRSLYFGPSVHLNAHAYATVVLHVGIYRPFRIKIANGAWQSCRCAIVPAGTQHELDFEGGIHGKIFIERDSSDFLYFKRRFTCPEQSLSFFQDFELIDKLRWIYELDPDKSVIENCLDSLLQCDGDLNLVVDPRVQAAINLICNEPDCNFSQEYLAERADLSSSRFLHLFKEHTDVPYRRFRTWKRLFLALENLNAIDNMTIAALNAGFSDATHFSHCFRDNFGINPAYVFRGINRFEA